MHPCLGPCLTPLLLRAPAPLSELFFCYFKPTTFLSSLGWGQSPHWELTVSGQGTIWVPNDMGTGGGTLEEAPLGGGGAVA